MKNQYSLIFNNYNYYNYNNNNKQLLHIKVIIKDKVCNNL